MFSRIAAASLILVVSWFLAACGSPADVPSGADGSMYLTEEIPPCAPASGSLVDPCEPDVPLAELLFPVAMGSRPYLGDEPRGLRDMLDGGGTPALASHLLVRGTFTPGSERCALGNPFQPASYLTSEEYDYVASSIAINCYADLRVNDYVLGSGPSTLTVQTFWYTYWDGYFADIAAEEGTTEAAYIEELTRRFETLEYAGGVGGREAILLISPPTSLSAEAWEVRGAWDVQRRDDETVVAVHPHRDIWRDLEPAGYLTHRSKLEMELPAFTQAVTAAHQARVAEYGGRIGAATNLPMLTTDANQLRKAMTDAGAYAAGTPTPAQPPPACGLAVPDKAANPGLMRDCTTLLAAKDALRGTAALNWAATAAITGWEGVTTSGMPNRATKVVLPNKSLSGSIPPELGRLLNLTHLDVSGNALTGRIPAELGLLDNLQELRLSGNTLTGCVPPALRSVKVNDLASLSLPDCAP